MAEVLRNCAANTDSGSSAGGPPVDYASVGDKGRIVKLLLDGGTDVNFRYFHDARWTMPSA